MTTEAVTPLRQRMIEDMNARKLGKHTQRGHIYSCKRFAGFIKRSPETATAEDTRHHANEEDGATSQWTPDIAQSESRSASWKGEVKNNPVVGVLESSILRTGCPRTGPTSLAPAEGDERAE